jgi:hypothetical protein
MKTRPAVYKLLLAFAGCSLALTGYHLYAQDTPSGASGSEEKEGVIHCANLIYAGVQTSRCFSDDFLSTVQKETGIPIARRFKSVKLDSPELFDFPFIMMTGEKKFALTKKERDNLRTYLDKGGFLVASAGCSSKEWDESFRREINALFEEEESRLKPIEMDHALWKTVYTIEKIELKSPKGGVKLAGLERNKKMVVVYSPEGLNDTSKVEGCCCCGGNEVRNASQLLVNIFTYSLLY